MSGWDQHNDNDREPPKGDDVELAWLLAFTVFCVLLVCAWAVWKYT